MKRLCVIALLGLTLVGCDKIARDMAPKMPPAVSDGTFTGVSALTTTRRVSGVRSPYPEVMTFQTLVILMWEPKSAECSMQVLHQSGRIIVPKVDNRLCIGDPAK